MGKQLMNFEGNLLYVTNKVITELEAGSGVLTVPSGYGMSLPRDKIYPGIRKLKLPSAVGEIRVYNANFPMLTEVCVEEDKGIFSGAYASAYTTDGKALYDKTGRELINAFSLARQEVLTIPEGVEVLGERSLSGGLFRELILPDSLRNIRTGALEGSLYSLEREYVELCHIYLENHVPAEEVQIPADVKEVRGSAFKVCCPKVLYTHVLPSMPDPVPGRLKELLLTGENTDYPQELLLSWVRKIKVSLPRGHFRYEVRKEGIYDKTRQAFLLYTPRGEKKVLLQEGTKIISPGAFRGAEELLAVYLPDSVEVIGEKAFAGCGNLRSVQRSVFFSPEKREDTYREAGPCCFPQSLKRIEKEAFAHCRNLLVDSFPEGLAFLGQEAFSGSDYWGRKADTISLPVSLATLEEGSLPWAEKYYRVCMGTAKGLMKAFHGYRTRLKLWDARRGDLPGYYEIDSYGGKGEISELWDRGEIAVDMMEKRRERAYEQEERLEISFFLCLNGWDQEGVHREYLKKNGVRMGEKLLKEGREEELIAFLKADILTLGGLEKLREAADKTHKVEMVAEILEAKERRRPKKVLKDFKL